MKLIKKWAVLCSIIVPMGYGIATYAISPKAKMQTFQVGQTFISYDESKFHRAHSKMMFPNNHISLLEEKSTKTPNSFWVSSGQYLYKDIKKLNKPCEVLEKFNPTWKGLSPAQKKEVKINDDLYCSIIENGRQAELHRLIPGKHVKRLTTVVSFRANSFVHGKKNPNLLQDYVKQLKF